MSLQVSASAGSAVSTTALGYDPASTTSANRSVPYSLEHVATNSSASSILELSLPDQIGFGGRVVGLALLLALAAFAALAINDVCVERRRRKLVPKASSSCGKGKERAPECAEHKDVADTTDEEAATPPGVTVAGPQLFSSSSTTTTFSSPSSSLTLVPTPSSLPPPPPGPASPQCTHSSALLTLSVVFLSVLLRIILVVVSFVATTHIELSNLPNPRLYPAQYRAGLETRWRIVRAQAFFDYGATTLFLVSVVVAARHLQPRVWGTRLSAALGWTADAIVCSAGMALWLAAWAVILRDVRIDYDSPGMFWAVIMRAHSTADAHLGLMIWTVVATVYASAVLLAKVVVSVRRRGSVRPAGRMVLAVFAGVTIPSILWQAVVRMLWGVTARMADFRTTPFEYRSQVLKMITIAITHPGEMIVLGTTVWAIQQLHGPSGKGARTRAQRRLVGRVLRTCRLRGTWI